MGARGVTAADSLCYSATLYDLHNNVVPYALMTIDHIGQTLTYKVTESDCGNVCWGTVLVEYKLGPQIVCPQDTTIECAALSFLELPEPDNLCAAVSITLQNEQVVDLTCDPELETQVIRTYRAVDEFGNSAVCSHNIFLKRLDPNNIIFPGKTIFSCSDPRLSFDEDGTLIPFFFQDEVDSLSLYGVPFLCTTNMVTPYNCPSTGILGNGSTGSGTGSGTNIPQLGVGYGIPLFPNSGGLIVEESGDTLNPFTFTEVIDDDRLGFLCGAAIVFTDTEIPFNNGCKRKIFRNWEIFQWDCGQEIAITSLQSIEIIDDTAPVIECPADQVVNINNGCEVNVDFLSAGVFDRCDPDVAVTIEYEGNVINGNGGSGLMLGGDNLVTYIARDRCNNADTCTVIIDVQDYNPPVALCEDGKIVSLRNGDNGITNVPAEIFDNGSFDDCAIDSFQVRRIDDTCGLNSGKWSETATFCCADATVPEVLLEFRVLDKSGNINNCEVYVVVQDKTTPVLTCPAPVTIECNALYDVDNLGPDFGYATLLDNCGDQPLFEVIDTDFNQCGAGVMTRQIQTIDINGNPTASCTQMITVFNPNPFTAIDIIWPSDIDLVNVCSLDNASPEELDSEDAFPRFLNEDCAVLAFDFEDQLISFNQGNTQCQVIKRSWTVINWCGAQPDSLEQFFNPIPQLIRLINTNAPVLDLALDVEVHTQNGDCDFGQLNIVRTAVDDCDDNLFWNYTILEAISGDTIGTGTRPEIIGKFPVGEYTVHWNVSDRCGNVTFATQAIRIIEGIAPTPLCHSGISVAIGEEDLNGDGIPESALVRLWAADLDAGSYPGCSGEILLSFSEDITDNNIIFDCTSIGQQQVSLYATDKESGAQDFCLGLVEIQDTRGLCGSGGLQVAIEGNIQTEEFQSVEDVSIDLDAVGLTEFTDQDGNYAFRDMAVGGSYTLQPSRDFDYGDGVSTVDLIRMQRHVLGVERLDSPYKIVSADINNDHRINGVDLVELRKLILGVYTELPANTSWRFVPADHVFVDPTNPWLTEMQEEAFIPALQSNMVADFIAMKVGDVDNSALGVSGDDQPNNKASVGFNFKSPAMHSGDIVDVAVYSNGYTNIAGWQGTLEFDSALIEVVSVKSETISDIDADHFFLNNQNDGWITVSYAGDNAATFTSEEVLFELVVRAKVNVEQSTELIKLSSSKIVSEAYDANLEPIVLGNGNEIVESARIIAVQPNPWRHNATLTFELAQKGIATIEFFDVNGRLIHSMENNYSRGENSVRLDNDNFSGAGLIYVRLTSAGSSDNMKMLLYK